MKRFFCTLIAILAVFCFASIAMATDMVIDKPIKQIVFKKDKNGNEYARIIVSEPRTLEGITYNKDVSVMAFGDMVPKIKTFKKGQSLKGIASQSEYRGGVSYQILELTK